MKNHAKINNMKKVATEQSTFENHRREVLWQIWLPVVILVLAFISLAILAAVGTARNPDNGTHWANISLILLIFPLIPAGLIVLAILSMMIYGIAKTLQILPTYSLIARTYIFQLYSFILVWADRLVQPVLWIQSTSAATARFFALIFSRKSRLLKDSN